ncbi:MAG TPA: DUF2631 domain-containing protein [Jatrophihabitans sp.]|nr:DUF2631 domain-containing protein [Jatrophihabitans sp.]
MSGGNASHSTSQEVQHSSSDLEHAAHEDLGAPERWGWHHEFRTGRQIGGWFTVLVLLLLLTATHYNRAGDVALILAAAVVAGGLLWDRQRRKTRWRS